MEDANGVLGAIATMEHANRAHIHSPTTVGEIVRQILEHHPLLAKATHEDVRSLVWDVAHLDGAHQVGYRIGGSDGGNLGGPGTWASTGTGKLNMLRISGTMPVAFPQDKWVEDTTVLMRATTEMRTRIEALGGDPAVVDLLRVERPAFGGEDRIVFRTPATPSGTDVFHVFLSHNPGPWSPSMKDALDVAARSIHDQHVHGEEIRRSLGIIQDRICERFKGLGQRVDETFLISVLTEEGRVTSVRSATRVTILGDAYQQMEAIIQMSDPHDLVKGEFDGFRIHSRDTLRRLTTLAGRDPIDAYTVCRVTAREYAGMDAVRAIAKAADVRRAMHGRNWKGNGEKDGSDFIDGRLVDTVYIADGVTFRNHTLMIKKRSLPDSVLMTLPGRPVTDVVDDPRLAGLVIERAKVDSKSRLSVVVRRSEDVPLRGLLEAMEAMH